MTMNEVYRRYKNLFLGIGKSASEVSETATKMIKCTQKPATECSSVQMRSDMRCHGDHRKIENKKTY